MAKNLIELVTGSLEDKKRWKNYKRRITLLPENYRMTVDAVERYLMYSGDGPMGGDRAATMFEDLADLFERAAADGTAIRDIVGEDPVEFVQAFARTYSDDGWIAKERKRLEATIARAAGEGPEQTHQEGN